MMHPETFYTLRIQDAFETLAYASAPNRELVLDLLGQKTARRYEISKNGEGKYLLKHHKNNSFVVLNGWAVVEVTE